MPDVNVSVMIDGKTVFVHGAACSPNPHREVLAGLRAAVDHFAMVSGANSGLGGGVGSYEQEYVARVKQEMAKAQDSTQKQRDGGIF